MNYLRNIISCIALFCIGLPALAQSSKEFKVSFEESKDLTSQQFKPAEEAEEPMASITAYILAEGIEAGLFYRIKVNKEWSEWQALKRFTEGTTEGRTTFDGGITEQAFTAIQFKSTTTLQDEVTFRVYYPGTTKKKSEGINVKKGAGANCSCAKPTICYRNCWCPSGNCPKDTSPSHTVADHLIVHHSAGSNSSSNYAAVVRSIWDFHVNTNGWSDIGYNFLIDANGIIYEARGDSVLGAHFSCMNHGTVGICLLGNFELAAPKDSAVNSLIEMLAWEACDKNIAPAEASYHPSSQLLIPNISGHSHANISTAPHGCPKGTLCPGDSLFQLLPMIRDSVKSFSCLGDVSIAEEPVDNELVLFPNPVNSTLSIKGIAAGETTIVITDQSGKQIFCKQMYLNSVEEVQLDVAFLPKGIYIITVQMNETSASQQFVKTE